MSVPTGIDTGAPVRARHEIDIDASPSIVWQLHTDVNNWPAWQPKVTAAHLDGPFEPGALFEWTLYTWAIVSTIYAATEGARTLWGDKSDRIIGVHDWVFGETPRGVHVTTEASFAGGRVDADVTGTQSMVDASLTAWLVHLKVAAESQS